MRIGAFFKKTLGGKRQLRGCLFFLGLISMGPQTLASAASPGIEKSWAALLHYQKGEFLIRDESFYLTPPIDRTLDSEQKALIQAFKNNHFSVICRFPARVLWLQKNLFLESTTDIFETCKELKEFSSQAPLDRLIYVFASEDISRPTSMMGHSYLKLEGVNAKGLPVEHAVSFFIDTDNSNYFKLIYETLFVGKKGIYLLSPAQTLDLTYLFIEKRNLWEYYLTLDEYSKKLIQYHIYELKHLEFKYFFHSFNCSTFDLQVLSVAYPELLEGEGLWITPVRILKKLNEKNYAFGKRIKATSSWKIKALEKYLRLTFTQTTAVLSENPQSLINLFTNDDEKYLALELLSSYNDFQFERAEKSQDDWSNKYDEIKIAKEALKPDAIMDLSSFKDPVKTPADHAVMLRWNRPDNYNTWSLGLLPASHFFMGDNSQYLHESELKLAEIYLDIAPQIQLNSLHILTVGSLSPLSRLNQSLSGMFDLSWKNQIHPSGSQMKSWNTQYGAGFTFTLGSDIDFYSLATFGYKESYARGYFEPQLGLLVRLIQGFKARIEYKPTFLINNENFHWDSVSGALAWNRGEWGLDLEYESHWLPTKTLTESKLTFRRHF